MISICFPGHIEQIFEYITLLSKYKYTNQTEVSMLCDKKVFYLFIFYFNQSFVLFLNFILNLGGLVLSNAKCLL